MRLEELIVGLPGARKIRGGNPEVTGLATDSRKVRPGDLFVAIRGGQEVDRHAFASQAVAAGAVAVAVEEDVPAGSAAVVQVESARRALPEISGRFTGEPWKTLRVVGVTGTNGKTTTAALIHAIFESAGLLPGLIGTIEYKLGNRSERSTNSTPEANELHSLLLEMRGSGCKSVVMEVTSHGLALDRVAGIRFETAVFTNFSRDHLDFHESSEAYLAAKALLFENLDSQANAVVNLDDPVTHALLARCSGEVVGYGRAEGAVVRILEGRADWQGVKLNVQTPDGVLDLDLSLRGRFNFWNAAAAVAAGFVSGVASDLITESLRRVQVPGRFEAIEGDHPFGVIVDYAHTPAALNHALKAARALTSAKVIVCFGCGGDRDPGKRSEMGEVSSRLADLTVVTSDNPRTEDPDAIIQNILPGLGSARYEVEPDRRLAIEAAIRKAKEGDVVLIAGKGHEDYQEVGRERIHFDDREIAREVLVDLS